MPDPPDELDELVRAVSNATRRRILRLCADRYVPAGEIASEIDLAPASVSEHLNEESLHRLLRRPPRMGGPTDGSGLRPRNVLTLIEDTARAD